MSRKTRESQARRYERSVAELRHWFTPARWDKVYPILQRSRAHPISLRLLEFLVGVYARNDNCPVRYYVRTPDGRCRLLNLYTALQNMQLTLRKKYLEPFARTARALPEGGLFSFGYGEKVVKRTNVAQLQFMRFLLENSVLEWLGDGDNCAKVMAAKRAHEATAALSIDDVLKTPSPKRRRPDGDKSEKRRMVRYQDRRAASIDLAPANVLGPVTLRM